MRHISFKINLYKKEIFTIGQTEFFYLYCLYEGLTMIDLQCGGDNFDCSLGYRCLAAVLQ